jgi:DNA-binding SARP family transcriptional activator/TolB-like protein
MIELLTLGTVDLRTDGGATRSHRVQPKPLALLVYLALARPRGVQRRDTLVALFWPELDEARARNALSQVIHRLRGALGEGSIVGHGQEEIGLDLERVTCDAIAFEKALEARELAEALKLYGGEFLNGFHVGEAPGFERWLDGERARLRRRAREAAEALAERAEAEGRAVEAMRWLRRAMAIAPDREEALRRLIRILDGAGERAVAVREYEEFARRLSEDYDLEPAPETQALIEEVRERERPLEVPESRNAPASSEVHDVAAGGRANQEVRPGLPRGVMREIHRRSLWQVLAVYLVGAAAGFGIVQALTEGLGLPFWFPWFAIVLFIIGLPIVLATAFVQHGPPWLARGDPVAPPGSSHSPLAGSEAGGLDLRRLLTWRKSIAAGVLAFAIWGVIAAGWLLARGGVDLLVAERLAFVNEGDRVLVAELENGSDQEYLAAAVREAIVTDLAQSAHVNVVELSQLSDVLDRMRLPDTVVVTSDLALEIARREGYPVVVTGSVGQIGSGYQVSARIVETATGRSVVRMRETAAAEGGVIDAIERVSRRVRRHLGESLASVRRSPPLPQVTTTSLEALQLLAGAREHFRRGDFREAITLAERAVELDTAFAAVYGMLAAAHKNSAREELADYYRTIAYRHADRLPERERLSLAGGYHLFRGHGDSAAHYLELLREVDPNRPAHNLGNAYLSMDRSEEALDMYRRSIELNPGNIVSYGMALYAARILERDQVVDSVLDLLQQRFPRTRATYVEAVGNALHSRDLDEADSIASAMVAQADPEIRAWGEYYKLFMVAMRGKLNQTLASADTQSARALRVFGPAGAAAFLRMSTAAALVAGDPALALPATRKAEPHLMGRKSLYAVTDLEVLASAYALAGEIDAANRVLAQIDSFIELGGFRTGSSHEVRAVIAFRQDRVNESLDELREAHSLSFGRRDPLNWWLWAEVHAAVGNYEEASAGYERVLKESAGGSYWSFYLGPLWPLAHERLGSIYVELGDTIAALRHLSSFAELWREADAGLQPRVEAARRAIARLSPDRPIQSRGKP